MKIYEANSKVVDFKNEVVEARRNLTAEVSCLNKDSKLNLIESISRLEYQLQMLKEELKR